jgi:hypothetical protein
MRVDDSISKMICYIAVPCRSYVNVLARRQMGTVACHRTDLHDVYELGVKEAILALFRVNLNGTAAKVWRLVVSRRQILQGTTLSLRVGIELEGSMMNEERDMRDDGKDPAQI